MAKRLDETTKAILLAGLQNTARQEGRNRASLHAVALCESGVLSLGDIAELDRVFSEIKPAQPEPVETAETPAAPEAAEIPEQPETAEQGAE